MPTELDSLCNCGKDKNTTHCPHCGRINFYAIKQTTARIHPVSNEITTCRIFRCRTCGNQFDDLQWQFECKAPVSSKLEQARKREDSKQELMRDARNGVRFDENRKRHFYRIVKMSYEDYVTLTRRAERQLEAKRNADAAVKLLENSKPSAMPVLEDKKLTPFQVHYESCNECMCNDPDYCAVGKNLKIAERMEQP